LDANKKEVLVMVTRSGSTDVLVLRADPSIILKAVTVETHKNDLP
jgi:hypothetical protein